MVLRLKILGAMAALVLTGSGLSVALTGGLGHGPVRASVCPPGTLTPTMTTSPTTTTSPTASGGQTLVLTPTATPGASPTSGPVLTVTGTVLRISSVQQGTEIRYYLQLTGSPLILTAPLSLSPQLPLVSVGDTITGTYQLTGTGTAALQTFSDESLTNPTTTPTPGSPTPTPGTPALTPTEAATATATVPATPPVTPTVPTCVTPTTGGGENWTPGYPTSPTSHVRLFANDSPWNVPIGTNVQLDPNSAQIASELAAGRHVPNIVQYGMPIYTGTASDPTYTVQDRDATFQSYQPIHIPDTATSSPGTDHWLVVYDQTKNLMFEMWEAQKSGNTWKASAAEVYSPTGDGVLQPGGAPQPGNGASYFGGVVTHADIERGSINHALSLITRYTSAQWRYPMHRSDGGSGNIPMGARLQLDPSVNCEGLPGASAGEKMICHALQTYGGYIRDTGDIPLAVYCEGEDLTDPGRTPPAGSPGDAGRTGGVFGKVGLHDLQDMPAIPWDKLRVLQAWNSFTPLTSSPAAPQPTLSPTPTTPSTGTPVATGSPTASSPTNLTPLGPGGSWKLAFADEFNGQALDTTKWATCYPNFRVGSADCTHDGGELELYTPQNVSESGGVLTLTANKQQTTVGGQTFNYTSGMMSSDPATVGGNGGFAFTYGYAEMQAKIPAGQGLWPAFWLLPTDGSWPPEMDVFEFLGNAPTVDQMHYHYPGGGGDQAVGTAWTGPDFSAGWHTFGIDWEPGSLTWYVDGVVRFQTSTAVTNKPMYLIANLAVGGDWPGNPDASTPFPARFQIKDIRVWQH